MKRVAAATEDGIASSRIFTEPKFVPYMAATPSIVARATFAGSFSRSGLVAERAPAPSPSAAHAALVGAQPAAAFSTCASRGNWHATDSADAGAALRALPGIDNAWPRCRRIAPCSPAKPNEGTT